MDFYVFHSSLRRYTHPNFRMACMENSYQDSSMANVQICDMEKFCTLYESAA